MGMTLHLMFHRVTTNEHCETSMVASLNAKQAMKLVQQQGLLQPKQGRSQEVPATEAQRTPTVQLVMNVPSQAASSHSMGGAQAMSLDFDEDPDDENSFHESSRHIMMQCCPIKKCLDPMWQTTKWLEASEGNLGEEDITWWPLLLLLTDGCNTATKELAKHLMTMWRWMPKVSTMPLCPPAPTVLNIRQFLDECPKEGDHTPWLLAYVHVLQHMGEAIDRRVWHPSGVCFTLQISPLVDAFIEETGVELMEADIASCWGQPLEEVL